MNDTYRSQFRLPNDLADRLRTAAEQSNRSMNAEIVARLQDSFDPSTARHVALAQDQLGAVMTTLERTLRHVEGLSRRLERMEKLSK